MPLVLCVLFTAAVAWNRAPWRRTHRGHDLVAVSVRPPLWSLPGSAWKPLALARKPGVP